jgi:hypothetical protein
MSKHIVPMLACFGNLTLVLAKYTPMMLKPNENPKR